MAHCGQSSGTELCTIILIQQCKYDLMRITLRFLDRFKVLIVTPCCFNHGVLGTLRQLPHHHAYRHTCKELLLRHSQEGNLYCRAKRKKCMGTDLEIQQILRMVEPLFLVVTLSYPRSYSSPSRCRSETEWGNKDSLLYSDVVLAETLGGHQMLLAPSPTFNH